MRRLKFSFLFILLHLSGHAMGLEFQTEWQTDKFQKSIVMKCQKNESEVCEETCAHHKKCEFREKTCRNCIGTNVRISHIFKEMGRSYRNTGDEVPLEEILYLLRSEGFASFTSRSIYNHTQQYNSPEIKKRFQSLCSDNTQYPIVLFGMKSHDRAIERVKFVICRRNYFEMTNKPRLQNNDKTELVQDVM